MIMKIKTCTLCKQDKPKDEFPLKYDNPQSPGRRRGQCKTCRNTKKRVPVATVRVCTKCGDERPLEGFENCYGPQYTRVTKRRICKACTNRIKNEQKKANRRAWKQWAGGSCLICGYDRCLDALDFHHRDPTEKSFVLSNKIGKITLGDPLTESEIAKCDLICANCHREIHSTSE